MRTPILIIILTLLTIPLFAQNQNNEIGIAIGSADMGDFGDAATAGFSYNRYWTRGLSTKFDATGFAAELTTVDVGPGGVTTAGDFVMAAYSGQFQYHFLRGRRFSPYFGAGLAYVITRFEDTPAGDLEADNTVTGIASAGVDLNLGRRWAITGDATYMPHQPEFPEGAATIDLDPLTLSVGAKFRW
jgi:outer membrane protein W